MNRRTFFAAVAPIAAMAAPAFAQAPIGAEPALPSGRLKADGTPAPAPDDKTPKKAKGPTEITAREGSFSNRDYKAIFTGEVEVKDPEFHLTCDRLTAFLKKPKVKSPGGDEPKPIGAPDGAVAAKKKDDSGLDRADAEGNVIIVQEKPDANGKLQRYTAKAKRAVFDESKGVMKLYGWPQVGQTIGGDATKQIISVEESCIITITREGDISWENGRAKTLLKEDVAAAPAPRAPQNPSR
jgi:lipopolysaccharide export system protein LptA